MPQLDMTLFSGHLLTLSLTLVAFYYVFYQFFLSGLFKVFFLQNNLFSTLSGLVPDQSRIRHRRPPAPTAVQASPESIVFWALSRRPRGFGPRLGSGLFLSLRLGGVSLLLSARSSRLVELRRYRLSCLRSYAVLLGFWNSHGSIFESSRTEWDSLPSLQTSS